MAQPEPEDEWRGFVPPKPCSTCGMVGGPYPDGDRPKSTALVQSGCPRCGWCH